MKKNIVAFSLMLSLLIVPANAARTLDDVYNSLNYANQSASYYLYRSERALDQANLHLNNIFTYFGTLLLRLDNHHIDFMSWLTYNNLGVGAWLSNIFSVESRLNTEVQQISSSLDYCERYLFPFNRDFEVSGDGYWSISSSYGNILTSFGLDLSSDPLPFMSDFPYVTQPYIAPYGSSFSSTLVSGTPYQYFFPAKFGFCSSFTDVYWSDGLVLRPNPSLDDVPNDWASLNNISGTYYLANTLTLRLSDLDFSSSPYTFTVIFSNGSSLQLTYNGRDKLLSSSNLSVTVSSSFIRLVPLGEVNKIIYLELTPGLESDVSATWVEGKELVDFTTMIYRHLFPHLDPELQSTVTESVDGARGLQRGFGSVTSGVFGQMGSVGGTISDTFSGSGDGSAWSLYDVPYELMDPGGG